MLVNIYLHALEYRFKVYSYAYAIMNIGPVLM